MKVILMGSARLIGSPISAVAIMTDTDNTLEQAVAYYGDIVFPGE